MHLTRKSLFSLLTLSSSALVLYGCGGSSSNSTPVPNPSAVSAPRRTGDLAFTLVSDKTRYTRGELVNLTFVITNVGNNILPVQYFDGIYTLLIKRGNEVIWDSPPGGIGARGTRNFNPAAGISYFTTWSQQFSTAEAQVPPGEYTLQISYNVANVAGTPVTREQARSLYSSMPVTITIL